jgi:MbtH protein
MNDSREQEPQYSVVMNAEEQYSIWPEGRDLPAGWKAAGKAGTKAECLAYIEEVWTDMRPLSLRRKMEERDAGGET